MDRYYLENPKVVTPDEESDDQKLIARTGDEHERSVLEELKASGNQFTEIAKNDSEKARAETLRAIKSKIPTIYQAALADDRFAGFADFLLMDESGRYQIWDTKLARAPKPYYAIQLCCYLELFAATTGEDMPDKFGIILGNNEKVEFRVEDFIHYYRGLKRRFLAMQDSFSGNLADRPEPLPGADHGRWTSYADDFFEEADHLVRVAGISVGQIKKLRSAGISTMVQLAEVTDTQVPKLADDSLKKLAAQARLQCQTRNDRIKDPAAKARFEILSHIGANDEPVGLATLPPEHEGDVYFDMEGYPLTAGGLEYLFGTTSINPETGGFEFRDWWAHSREEEKCAFEGFIDWVHARWRQNPTMHIYHYAAYEVNAVSRLSTRHDTRQDEVDDLLRANVFVDLYKIVRHGLRIGEDSYSIKSIEQLYRQKRETDVATAAQSIVQYAHWMGSKQPPDWNGSAILKNIRDYNEDDCRSNADLTKWLRALATNRKIAYRRAIAGGLESAPKDVPPEIIARHEVIERLRERQDAISHTLADLIDFHRREEKPMWWRMFDRAEATSEELRDDSGCIEGVKTEDSPSIEKQSLVQDYGFDPSQECKLVANDKARVMFAHNLDAKFTLTALNSDEGSLRLKIGKKTLAEKFDGEFPGQGSLIPYEYVPAVAIQTALAAVASKHLDNALPASVTALLQRIAPAAMLQGENESTTDAAIRVAQAMTGGCLVVQGPPGTGKTYTAAQVIHALVSSGKKVGVASNSHKAIVNLLTACGEATRTKGIALRGVKVGGDDEGPLFDDNPHFHHVESNKEARAAYGDGVIGGTAWLFTLPEWEGVLDYIFID